MPTSAPLVVHPLCVTSCLLSILPRTTHRAALTPKSGNDSNVSRVTHSICLARLGVGVTEPQSRAIWERVRKACRAGVDCLF
jgi:hypothetical protein